MNEQQQEFAQFLFQVLTKMGKIERPEQFQEVVQGLGEEKLNKIAQEYSKIKTATDPKQQQLGLQAIAEVINSQNVNQPINTMQNQSVYARLGAKLNYLNALRGKCPEGYEVASYGNGGVATSCRKCQQKVKGGDVVERFKKEKCGGKNPKINKHEDGKPVGPVKTTTKHINTANPFHHKGNTLTTYTWGDGTTTSKVTDANGVDIQWNDTPTKHEDGGTATSVDLNLLNNFIDSGVGLPGKIVVPTPVHISRTKYVHPVWYENKPRVVFPVNNSYSAGRPQLIREGYIEPEYRLPAVTVTPPLQYLYE